jgi:hypothetical protein
VIRGAGDNEIMTCVLCMSYECSFRDIARDSFNIDGSTIGAWYQDNLCSSKMDDNDR